MLNHSWLFNQIPNVFHAKITWTLFQTEGCKHSTATSFRRNLKIFQDEKKYWHDFHSEWANCKCIVNYDDGDGGGGYVDVDSITKIFLLIFPPHKMRSQNRIWPATKGISSREMKSCVFIWLYLCCLTSNCNSIRVFSRHIQFSRAIDTFNTCCVCAECQTA